MTTLSAQIDKAKEEMDAKIKAAIQDFELFTGIHVFEVLIDRDSNTRLAKVETELEHLI